MRYLVMHKNDAHTEAGELPGPELIAQMGAYIQEHLKSGVFLGGEGLSGSKNRTRLTFRGGRCDTLHGPYVGVNELPAELLVVAVTSRDEALRWAERYGAALGDGEIEVGAVNEPWDLGMGPRPPDAPLRFLFVVKADAVSESGRPRPARQAAALAAVTADMTAAGGLAGTHRLKPSAESKRLHFDRNQLRVTDGPFAESKELIGGFSILQLPDMAAVLEECKRYAAILGGTLEIDARPVAD